MSDDTQRDEKAKLLLEYAENKQQLQQLTARIERFGDALVAAGNILKSTPTKLVVEGESTPIQHLSPRIATIDRSMFDLNAIIDLRDSIRHLQERQVELEPRLSAFGLSI